MSRMSDLHIEIQEMLSKGHCAEWTAHKLNVPLTVVQEIHSEMNDETNDDFSYNFSEIIHVF